MCKRPVTITLLFFFMFTVNVLAGDKELEDALSNTYWEMQFGGSNFGYQTLNADKTVVKTADTGGMATSGTWAISNGKVKIHFPSEGDPIEWNVKSLSKEKVVVECMGMEWTWVSKPKPRGPSGSAPTAATAPAATPAAPAPATPPAAAPAAAPTKAPAAAPSVSLSGKWSSKEYGDVTMEQTGNKVVGSYQYKDKDGVTIDGKIEGSVQGKTVTAKWFERPKVGSGEELRGDAEWTITDDGKMLAGWYRYEGEKEKDDWSLTR